MVIYFIDIQFNTESSVDVSVSVCNKYSVKYERWQLIDQDSDDIECWLREEEGLASILSPGPR